jgi:hypothetical protein
LLLVVILLRGEVEAEELQPGACHAQTTGEKVEEE